MMFSLLQALLMPPCCSLSPPSKLASHFLALQMEEEEEEEEGGGVITSTPAPFSFPPLMQLSQRRIKIDESSSLSSSSLLQLQLYSCKRFFILREKRKRHAHMRI